MIWLFNRWFLVMFCGCSVAGMMLWLCFCALALVLQPVHSAYNCSAVFNRVPGESLTFQMWDNPPFSAIYSTLTPLFLVRQQWSGGRLWHQHDHSGGKPVHRWVGRLWPQRPGPERGAQYCPVQGHHWYHCQPTCHPLPSASQPHPGEPM